MKVDTKPDLISVNAVTPGELSENEAVRLAQEGDSGGFERIYQLHSGRVYGLCLQMVKDPVEAEDLTHDAFLQAFRKIQTFRGEIAILNLAAPIDSKHRADEFPKEEASSNIAGRDFRIQRGSSQTLR
jgi:hypothetical protein